MVRAGEWRCCEDEITRAVQGAADRLEIARVIREGMMSETETIGETVTDKGRVLADIASVMPAPRPRPMRALAPLPALRLEGIGEDIRRIGETASFLRETIASVHEEHAGLRDDLTYVKDRLREHREDLRFQLGGGNSGNDDKKAEGQ